MGNWESGQPIAPFNLAAIEDFVAEAGLPAGLPDVPLHSMRHTAASLLRAIGTPDRIRMDMLGHASLAVTDGYTHTETGDQAAFTRALERLLLPTPDP